MDESQKYQAFLRNRITQLREQKKISEYGLSLKLGKSGSYIRSITNGVTLPSLRELFNIFLYFDISPAEFFSTMEERESLRTVICEKLRELSDKDLEQVLAFICWIQK